MYILNQYLQTCYIHFFPFYPVVVRGNSVHRKNGFCHQIYFIISLIQICLLFKWGLIMWKLVGSVLPLTTVCSLKKISTICIYINMNVCFWVLICIFVWVCVCMYVCMCMYVYMYICKFICIYVDVCICTCVCIYICVACGYEHICFILIGWFIFY